MTAFVTNCWYAAAWADEVDETPFARRLLDIPMVFFRTAKGGIAALHDRCPHRYAPLSRGKVKGDSIQCGYHGLCFDAAGQCSESPFGLPVPPGTRIRGFRAVERYGCIWIWPGDQALADPELIPDYSYHVDPAYRVVKGRLHINAHFELITDNLLDLSHTRFLHPAFGGDAWQPEISFEQDGETVYACYDLPSSPPTDFSEGFFPSEGQNVRERDSMRWDAPACMYLHMDIGLASEPDGPTIPQPSSHIVTPETATTSHYFWASGALQQCPIDDDFHREAMEWAFRHEDAPMLEAAQAAMEGQDFWDLHPSILEYDKAAIRARRIMRKRLHHELKTAGGD